MHASAAPRCLLPKSGKEAEGRLTRQMHPDGKKRRSFVALLFPAGDLQSWAEGEIGGSRYEHL